MALLINLLIWMLIFACIGYGLYLACMKFFPEFPPARWICGAVLLIMMLIFLGQSFSGGNIPRFYGQ